MKKLIKFLTIAMCFGFLSGYVGEVQALTVPWYMMEVNQLSDNSAEYLLNKVYGSTDGKVQGSDYLYSGTDEGGDYYYTTDNGDTILAEGDRLRGGFTIHSLEGLASADTKNIADLQFGGVFEIEVLSRSYADEIVIDGTTYDQYDYVFGASSDFETKYGQGAIVAQYLDDTTPYNRQTDSDAAGVFDEETQIALAENGDLYWIMGFTGDGGASTGGEGWIAKDAPEDISIFRLYATDDGVGDVKFALNLVNNLLGPELGLINQSPAGALGDGSPVHMTGNAGLLGIWDSETEGVIPPFDNWDNLDAKVKPIPEPATMLLLGSGLIGLAGFGRKKKFFKKD